MKYKFISFLFLIYISNNLFSIDIPTYSAKYNFESDEISITGIREFYSEDNLFGIKFQASNLFANLFFLSEFNIVNEVVLPLSYQIKIRPKFLDRDQLLSFDYENNEISSNGINEWVMSINDQSIFDPLNVQIMIRKYVKNDLKEFNLNIIDMEEGGYKKYTFKIIGSEECYLKNDKFECLILQRTSDNSERKVTYYLAKELEYMFLKIIDTSPERTNKLKLIEILSLG